MWIILLAAIAVVLLLLMRRQPDRDRAAGYLPNSYEARTLRGEL